VTNLLTLPAHGEDGSLHVIVETPRGASIKFKYEPTLAVFTVWRALPIGLTYPFDWGFIPRTLASDGDPLDALAIHDASRTRACCCPAGPSEWWSLSRMPQRAGASATIG